MGKGTENSGACSFGQVVRGLWSVNRKFEESPKCREGRSSGRHGERESRAKGMAAE